MALLRLQEAIVYGPVSSRRLGCSLGLNILPVSYKLCSLNCVYCQYGWTKTLVREADSCLSELPGVEDVTAALTAALQELKENGVRPSYVTFSGNGEPTLHPQFEQIVESVKKVRDRLAPEALVAILSNSTTVGDKSVRRALEKLDVRVMKLDCGAEEGFSSYNRPCPGVELEEIIGGLKRLKKFSLQSLFTNLNSDDESVKKWLSVLKVLKPLDVQVYTLDRSAPLAELKAVSKSTLEEIARRVKSETGIPAEVF